MLLLLLACHPQPWPRGEACACEAGHGVMLCEQDGRCGPCMCLVPEPQVIPGSGQVSFYLSPQGDGDGSEQSPWSTPDWAVVDAALSDSHVSLYFQAGQVWPDKLVVQRSDASDNHLFLHGDRWGADGQRAVIPGIGTGYDGAVVSRVTIEGFEITGSRDKGVQWQAGDHIVIVDNLIHDNAGSPAVYLDYSSRSGHASEHFQVKRNHIWNQRGECIYIGGSGGEEAPSHDRIRITENIVHDCWLSVGTHHDGINLKDRLQDVEVRRNVIFNTDWGIEAASPGLFESNLVFSTHRNGLHLVDAWGSGLGGSDFRDNAVLWAGHAGVYLNASEQRWEDVLFDGLTVVGSGEAGIELGGEQGISGTLDRVLLVDNTVGFDAWDPVELEVGQCWLWDNALDADREWAGVDGSCEGGDPGLGNLDVLAGPDLVFFTEDDPWRSEAGATP